MTPPNAQDLELPPWWKETLDAYFDIDTTSYLSDSAYAVLTNDLRQTYLRGDSTTIARLRDILTYIERWNCPQAWGSKQAVDEWSNGPNNGGVYEVPVSDV